MRSLLLAAVSLLVPAVASADDADKALLDALSRDQAMQKAEYKYVRSAVARHFERKYADEIRLAFGDEQKAITDCWPPTRTCGTHCTPPSTRTRTTRRRRSACSATCTSWGRTR